MRLRITVRRHDLPDCPIVWDANTETHALTVSELLLDINEVVPIESGEWGLEDYAVEVKGTGKVNYECLHFQPVSRVMKEDDEVMCVIQNFETLSADCADKLLQYSTTFNTRPTYTQNFWKTSDFVGWEAFGRWCRVWQTYAAETS
jgi:hypothetical protein